MERICNTCQILKPFTEFHFDKRFNLPFARCKPCYNNQCKIYRQNNKVTYRKWVTSERGKEVRHNAIQKWRSLNSAKRQAHSAVSNALRDGRLIKQPCKECNDPITEGHHTSYDKEHWLNVIWLCKKHHTEITYKSC